MKVAIAWDFISARPGPTGLLVNPVCPAVLRDMYICGLPASVRVTDCEGRRSTFWCPIHCFPRTELDFDSPRWEDYYTDWETYWRLWPSALDRQFICWVGTR